ncbi:MAG: GntR family transcriptional regulator, partial [Acidimicrobiales bacterium]|nr:GntR family transcriptional regulator [Acidimicrobiales bacterium]
MLQPTRFTGVIRVSTAQELAYSKIRHAILTGVLRPGIQLRQEELAEEFNMSRTAVRFAIQALADDGIVEISDTRRSFVADITETHAEETFDIL